MSKDDPSAGALWDENQKLRAEVEDLRRAVADVSFRLKAAQAALDALSDVIYVRDADYRFILVNQSYLGLVGAEREKLVGARDVDLLPARAVERVRASDQKALDAGAAVVTEEQIPIGGGLRTYVSTKFLVYGMDGAVAALGGVASDITERRQAESALRSSQALLQAVLDGSPSLIFVKDTEGRYILANQPAARAISREPHDMLGKTDYDFLPKDTADFIRARDKHVLDAGEPIEREEVIHRYDGEHIFLTSTYPLRNDEGVTYGICAVATDITDRKRQEAERARLQEQVIEAQKSALRELSTPLIPLAEHVVIMPLIGSIDRARAEQALETLLRGAAQHRAEVAILDITGVSNVDAEVASALVRAAKAVELLGARTILTGVRPEVAQTLVTLGFDLGGIVTSGSLQSGVAHALARIRARR